MSKKQNTRKPHRSNRERAEKARAMRAEGKSYTAIGEELGTSASSVHRWCNPDFASKAKTPRVMLWCEQCLSEFEVPQWRERQGHVRFCSRPCKDEWQKSQPMDPRVRAIFLDYARNQPPLPDEIRKKKADAIRGPKHWRWKGGVTSENRRLRASFEYRQWRTAVFERDGFECQECGDTTGGKPPRSPHQVLCRTS